MIKLIFKSLFYFTCFCFLQENISAQSWEEVKKNRKGIITVNWYQSDNFISDKNGSLEGIEYDILQEFKEHLASQGIDLTLNFEKANSFSELYNSVKNGKNGTFGACTFSITEQRKKEVLFSPKYMRDIEVLINSQNIPVVKNNEEFIQYFSDVTALNVPNTTFEEDLEKLKVHIPNLKIENVPLASEIKERIANEPSLCGYIELPIYLKSLKEGYQLRRQYIHKVERNGYGIIFPMNSDWKGPVDEFFESQKFKIKVNGIIEKHLGKDVQDLLWKIDTVGSANQEISLLTMEKELQNMELNNKNLLIKKKELESKNERRLLTGIILFVGIISVIIWFAYRVKIKSNKALKDKNQLIENQKEDLVLKNSIIESKNKDITDSINYAKKIQDALLPSQSILKNCFADYFVLFKPKDIVSGDFYWFADEGDYCLIVLADCTGHGVPGAFMSMMGTNFLSQIITDDSITSTAEALRLLDEKVKKALKNEHHSSKDGMDIVMLAYNKKTMELDFSGGMNSIILLREEKLSKIKGDRISIGADDINQKTFTEHKIQLQPGDHIYTYTDGFQDQFGGPKGKKFMEKRILNIISDNQDMPLSNQKNVLEESLNEWMKMDEQIDDISVIGFKV